MFIDLDGIPIEIIRKSVKNINLRVSRIDGSIKVSVPLRLSLILIYATLEEKKAWISLQHHNFLNSKPSSIETTTLYQGMLIPYLGHNYLLHLEEHHGPNQVRLHEGTMHYYANSNTSDLAKIGGLDTWYKQQMQHLIPDLLTYWEPIINVKSSEWVIKKMKSRWGSCNTRTAKICLNLNLIKKPLICLEYVLVHELVHLLEASHNKRFYQMMNRFMPEWRKHQLLLETKHVE